jgi:hypothetical protein|tara:strand:+ start:232 stop:840 length:609 start_codon:yes stop_codon:yes gene_type:complete
MIKILLISLALFSCNVEKKIQEIEVGKTIKIEPTNFSSSDDELIYLWEPPKSPKGSKPFIDIKNNKMLFTADIEGEYEINLTVESNGKSIYEETFFMNATKSKSNFISTKKDSIKDTKEPIPNKKYTIQVASWPNLEQARKDQIGLRDNGYDAYTEQYYIKSKNQLWWRVRVGNFSDKSIAEKVRKKLSKFRGNDIWIDVIE